MKGVSYKDWQNTTLADAVEILDNKRIPINSKERKERISGKSIDEVYPYYGATGQVDVIDDYLLDGEFVLLGEDGAPFLNPFKNKAYIVNGKIWVNNHAHILRSYGSNKFLCYYLNQINYREFVTGTTRLKLNQSAMKQIPITLPPLPEQHRIVAKIEELFSELDAGVESLIKAKEQLKTYRQAVLKAAFEGKLTEDWRNKNHVLDSNDFLKKVWIDTDIPRNYKPFTASEIQEFGKIPSSWEYEKIGNICRSIVPNRDKPKTFSGSIPWITTPLMDINGIKIDIAKSELGLTEEEVKDYNARLIPQDSVIMTCVGNFGVVGINSQPCVINQQLHAFITHSFINPLFLAYALKRRKNYMEQEATSTTVSYLNKTKCNSMPIPVCDLQEQKIVVQEIETRLSVCDNLEQTIEQELKQSESLRHSILKRAFEGRLVLTTNL